MQPFRIEAQDQADDGAERSHVRDGTLSKVGDMVTVVYWPTLNKGKEAGDIAYSDLEKLRAWNKANKAHLKEE